MQGALGELTFESEAAERLRSDLRNERASIRSLQGQLSQAQVDFGTCLALLTARQIYICLAVRYYSELSARHSPI